MKTHGHLLVVVGLLIGCKREPPAPPEPVIAVEKLCSDAAYDSYEDPKTADTIKKRVTVEGYLDIPRGMFTLCSQRSCSVTLLPEPGATDRAFTVSLKIGDDPARMKTLPEKYSEKDLEVTTTDGKTVGAGAKVRVTGKRLGQAKNKGCQLVDVDRVDGL